MKRDRRSRRRISNEDAVAITLAKFRSHPPRSLDDLAEEFDREPAVISRTITRAFRDGLVEVMPARYSVPPPRKESLERRLLERYEGLSGCIVLDSQEPTTPADDDRLHDYLGGAMAALIASGTVFRDKDVIGLGSGRGVYHTVRNLGAHAPLKARVTLCSLTGQVHPRDHSEQVNVLMDADIHLGMLGVCFKDQVTLHPISHAIVCGTADEARRVLNQSRLSEAAWKAGLPTHALVGVGVLAEGHRFYRHVKTGASARSHLLRSIEGPLEQLVKICDIISGAGTPFYCPVADIANRLFFVPPPDGVRLPSGLGKDTLERKVKSLIDDINSRLVTVRGAQLHQIAHIMLVAGSRRKAGAVRQLLLDQYPLRFVCVDQQLATELLG